MTDLRPLPPQPAGVPWPTEEWPASETATTRAVASLVDEMFDDAGRLATTYACVVVHHGAIVAERYAGEIPHFDRAAEPVTGASNLLSWSMAKSMLHAVVGMLVADGLLDLQAPVDVPGWGGQDDPRAAITLEDLLAMRDGLDFLEDYVDATRSDVIDMLFGAGAADVATHAANRGVVAPPDTRFNYSSGTSNIVSGIVARALGTQAAYQRYLDERLFGPIGMRSATARFDEAGTWIASSYVYCTARDFARFGYLYLRDGVWGDARVLPEGWVDHGRRIRSSDEAEGTFYGAHWWCLHDEYGSFRASGYEGQSILIVPALDLVVVRLGKTDAARYPDLADWRRRVIATVAGIS